MKTNSMFNRRGFIKRGLMFLPAIYLPKFGDNPIVVELFNRDGSEVIHLPRSGLQAASTIKQRTVSSIVDNRIRLINSNFARLWSTDVGTTWTKIRVGCRISIEDSGAAITGTPRFAQGICSGTSNIYLDATTTHWGGTVTNGDFGRVNDPPVRYYNAGNLFVPAKRISTTLTVGTGFYASYVSFRDTTAGQRAAMFLDITKGSPNFTFNLFSPQSSSFATDCSLATYLAQIALTSPTITEHAFGSAQTLAIDEVTYGYFNAINFAWDRSSALEVSDVAVVRLT